MLETERSVELVIANPSLVRRVSGLVDELGLRLGWRASDASDTGFAKSQADILVAGELSLEGLERLSASCTLEGGMLLLGGESDLGSRVEELFGTGLGFAALSAEFMDEDFLVALPAVARGFVLRPSIRDGSEVAASGFRGDQAGDAARGPLNMREHEVLALLAEGASNRQIAADLGISENTVKFHLQALYRKLGVSSRAGAVFEAMKLGELRM